MLSNEIRYNVAMVFKRVWEEKVKKDVHLKELFSGAFAALFLRVLGLVFSYLFIMLITRYYGAQGMGIFALSLTLINVLTVFARGGTNLALMKFTAQYSATNNWGILRDIYKKILIIITPLSLVFSLSLFLGADFLATKFFGKPYLTPYFKIASFGIVPMTFLTVHSEGLRGFKKIKEFVFLQFFGLNLLAFLLLLIVNFGFGFNFTLSIKGASFSPIVSYIFSSAVMALLGIVLWKRALNKKSKNALKERGLSFSEIFSVSFPMLLSSSMFMVIGWADTVMLGIFENPRDVGIYNVALRVSRLVGIVQMSVNSIAAPKFAEFWAKKEIDLLANFAKKAAKLVFFVMFPIIVVLWLFPEKVLMVFGKEFQAGGLVLIILATAMFINSSLGAVGNVVQMTGHHKFHRNVVFIAMIVNIILNLILIPKFGIVGAAFSSFVAMVFWNVVFSIKVKNITGKWIFPF